jgi:hypothetical protein
LISNLQVELKRYTDITNKTDLTIRDIQRKIKDLDKKSDIKYRQIVRGFQLQVKEMQRKIERIDRSMKSTNKLGNGKLASGKKGKYTSKKKSKK